MSKNAAVEKGLGILNGVIQDALKRSGKTLAQMSSRDISLDGPGLQRLPLNSFMHIAGGPDSPVVSIHLSVTGDFEGDLLLILPYDQAPGLIAMVLGEEIDIQKAPENGFQEKFLEDEIAVSVLCELGNVVGTAFLNVLGNTLDMVVLPSVPHVMADFAGSILTDLVITSVSDYREEILAVNTTFNEVGREIYGFFLLLPKPGTFEPFLNKVARSYEKA